eukprot:489873_1
MLPVYRQQAGIARRSHVPWSLRFEQVRRKTLKRIDRDSRFELFRPCVEHARFLLVCVLGAAILSIVMLAPSDDGLPRGAVDVVLSGSYDKSNDRWKLPLVNEQLPAKYSNELPKDGDNKHFDDSNKFSGEIDRRRQNPNNVDPAIDSRRKSGQIRHKPGAGVQQQFGDNRRDFNREQMRNRDFKAKFAGKVQKIEPDVDSKAHPDGPQRDFSREQMRDRDFKSKFAGKSQRIEPGIDSKAQLDGPRRDFSREQMRDRDFKSKFAGRSQRREHAADSKQHLAGLSNEFDSEKINKKQPGEDSKQQLDDRKEFNRVLFRDRDFKSEFAGKRKKADQKNVADLGKVGDDPEDADLGVVQNGEIDLSVKDKIADSGKQHLSTLKSASSRRDAVKSAFIHAWSGYERVAFGHDEVRPNTNVSYDPWQGFGATLVDALDTMAIMGLDEQLARAREFVEKVDFVRDAEASFFEFTIRYVGGLLGAHSVTGDKLYLDKAQEMADRLMLAFPDEDGSLPRSVVNLKTGEKSFAKWNQNNALLAEIGSCQVEFAYLSHHTGDPKYYKKARAVYTLLHGLQKEIPGLYPVSVKASGRSFVGSHISLGGLGDSFYEYLLKTWLITGRSDDQLLQMYTESAEAVAARLVKRVTDSAKRAEPFVFLSEMEKGRSVNQMEHLQCFAGGMFALGASQSEVLDQKTSKLTDAEVRLKNSAEYHMKLGAELTETCAAVYSFMKTGLAPEMVVFKDGEFQQSGWSPSSMKKYILRPETVESLFVLYRTTHDEIYRDMGWEIFKAIEESCRTDVAYSGLKDVTKTLIDDPDNLDDRMESFFLAETLKYLYLLFSDPVDGKELIPLDEFVFNTEAHPLRIFQENSQNVEKDSL